MDRPNLGRQHVRGIDGAAPRSRRAVGATELGRQSSARRPRAQIEFGLAEAGYGYWGFSPAWNPDGGYRTGTALTSLALIPWATHQIMKRSVHRRPHAHRPINQRGRHAVRLVPGLAIRAPEAMENLRKLKGQFPDL